MSSYQNRTTLPGTDQPPERSNGYEKDYCKTENRKPKTEEKSEAITLEQALKEEGEGRTPESIRNEGKKPIGPSKMHQATEIMEEIWDDIQAGKVKRKDVIKRFINDVSLTPKGAATYFGSIKKKLTNTRRID